jgi:hypothetical protein
LGLPLEIIMRYTKKNTSFFSFSFFFPCFISNKSDLEKIHSVCYHWLVTTNPIKFLPHALLEGEVGRDLNLWTRTRIRSNSITKK